MKAVIFATLIVLKLIISSASAPAEPEDFIVTALEKQAALDNEDAEENSGMNNSK